MKSASSKLLEKLGKIKENNAGEDSGFPTEYKDDGGVVELYFSPVSPQGNIQLVNSTSYKLF